MKLKLYNTLTKEIEEFAPINKENIRLYSCGPTVYHYAHIGNLRAYIFADILQKTIKLQFSQSKITHVINITDVGHNTDDGDNGEDKIEKGSKREGKSAWEIAKYYEEAFKKDLGLLNINLENFVFTRATEYIKEQIDLVQNLEQKGFTYNTEDGVYFDTSKFPAYADFARLDVKNLNGGERVEIGDKKNITDFALWKFSPQNEKRQMEWSSPWGIGFPGWHIECSAMSNAILGSHFDIHTGGKDHIPVHHTNEIAQSECAHDGEKYVNYWCHVNFINDKNGKMSKSNGDFLRLQTVIENNFTPDDFKYYLLQAHYRKEIEFSWEALKASQSGLNSLKKKYNKYKTNTPNIILDMKSENTIQFKNALFDDINTAKALAIIQTTKNYKEIKWMAEILGITI